MDGCNIGQLGGQVEHSHTVGVKAGLMLSLMSFHK